MSDSVLTIEERETVALLRAELNSGKQCYTNFSFQAGAIGAGAIALIIQFQADRSILALGGLAICFLLHSVVRIGLHKFENANRLSGFELYLHRRTRLIESEKSWNDKMRKIGWEEAFYAWRVIQPAIYTRLYERPSNQWDFTTATVIRDEFLYAKEPNILLSRLKKKDFEPVGTTVTSYRAGSYMKKTFFVLHVFSFVACFPLLFAASDLVGRSLLIIRSNQPWGDYLTTKSAAVLANSGLGMCFILLFLLSIYYGYKRTLRVDAKRDILENGLMSINSSAIVWNLSVMAHFRALAEMSIRDTPEHGFEVDCYREYSEKLNAQVEGILANIHDVYQWVLDKDYRPPDPIPRQTDATTASETSC